MTADRDRGRGSGSGRGWRASAGHGRAAGNAVLAIYWYSPQNNQTLSGHDKTIANGAYVKIYTTRLGVRTEGYSKGKLSPLQARRRSKLVGGEMRSEKGRREPNPNVCCGPRPYQLPHTALRRATDRRVAAPPSARFSPSLPAFHAARLARPAPAGKTSSPPPGAQETCPAGNSISFSMTPAPLPARGAAAPTRPVSLDTSRGEARSRPKREYLKSVA